jgi:hypothetical protein
VADRGRTDENLDAQPPAGGPERANGVPRVPGASGTSSAPDPTHSENSDSERNRRMRRAQFLADLAEARELRKRVAPRRARAAELHARVLRTFRY